MKHIKPRFEKTEELRVQSSRPGPLTIFGADFLLQKDGRGTDSKRTQNVVENIVSQQIWADDAWPKTKHSKLCRLPSSERGRERENKNAVVSEEGSFVFILSIYN